jgi:hypothetical protein
MAGPYVYSTGWIQGIPFPSEVFNPGVGLAATSLTRFGTRIGMKVPRDIPGGNRESSQHAEREMCEVLADALSDGNGFLGRGVDPCDPRNIGKEFSSGFAHRFGGVVGIETSELAAEFIKHFGVDRGVMGGTEQLVHQIGNFWSTKFRE